MTSATTEITVCTAYHQARVRRPIAPTLLLMLLLIASVYLRFDGLDCESRWCDEYQQTSSYSMSPAYVVLTAREAAQPPLDYLLGWAIHKLDPSLWAMRAPAAVFGIISIALTFALVRRFAGWPCAIVAASLVAFSPLHYQMSQTARPYTIFLAILLLTMMAMIAALRRPDWRRQLLYGVCAMLLVLTRGMAPAVILLAAAITLGLFMIFSKGPQARIGLRRTWATTMIVGLAAVGVTAFLVAGDRSWSILSTAGTSGTEYDLTSRLDRLADNIVRWTAAPSLYFADAAAYVMAFAGIGAICTVAAWRRIPRHGRVLVILFAIAGPLFILVYSVAVRQWPLAPRYAFFLLPFVAGLSSVGIVLVASLLVRRLGCDELGVKWSGVVAGLALVAFPAHATYVESKSYSNPDWRGCAAFLKDRVTSEDVIMVIQDRPLGEYQSTFWGKYEWPRDFDAPLAEAAQTFVTSPSHWDRLLHKTGRCFLVIYHQVAGESADAYLQAGLQSAPAGSMLTKFRGLDLLELQTSQRGLSAVAEACRVCLRLPMVHEDVWTIPRNLVTKIERAPRSP